MSTEEKAKALALAKEVGELTAAIVNALPIENEEQGREYLAIIKEGIDNATVVPMGKSPVKEITENAIDVLEAIAALLPETQDKAKQKHNNRFKRAVGVIKNLFHLFGA